MRRSLEILAVLVSVVGSLSGPLDAQGWPAKPVKIVAPFAPGGTSDELARILAASFTLAYQQTFYVENRPGAGGIIGSAAVAMAEPDGYQRRHQRIGHRAVVRIQNRAPRHREDWH